MSRGASDDDWTVTDRGKRRNVFARSDSRGLPENIAANLDQLAIVIAPQPACDPYIGYSKNDKSACGSYGYIRSPYESAKRELKDALNNVALFCGPCDGLLASFMRESKKNSKNLESEIDRLKKRLLELEAENEALNKKIKPTQ